jgi:hypothetical protein
LIMKEIMPQDKNKIIDWKETKRNTFLADWTERSWCTILHRAITRVSTTLASHSLSWVFLIPLRHRIWLSIPPLPKLILSFPVLSCTYHCESDILLLYRQSHSTNCNKNQAQVRNQKWCKCMAGTTTPIVHMWLFSTFN